MTILAIDTSEGSSVALTGDPVRRAQSSDPRAHADQLAVLLTEVLAGGGIPEAVVVGTGPAPFTGLRAGIVTGSAFAFARGLPLWGVPSLDAIARTALDSSPGGLVTVVTDARRREVYAATYREAGPHDVERLGDFYVGPAAELHPPDGAAYVGPATLLYPDLLPGTPVAADPAVLARIAAARSAAGLPLPTQPLYLRRPDAKVPTGRARATTPPPAGGTTPAPAGGTTPSLAGGTSARAGGATPGPGGGTTPAPVAPAPRPDPSGA